MNLRSTSRLKLNCAGRSSLRMNRILAPRSDSIRNSLARTSRALSEIPGGTAETGRLPGLSARKSKSKHEYVNGVRRIDDPFHPRGYREICTDEELRRRKLLKMEEPMHLCGICWLPLSDDPNHVQLDHIKSKGMGGAQRDDHLDNLQATHPGCNMRKGSKKADGPLLGPYLREIRSQQCLCSQSKKPGRKTRPFCDDCMNRVSPQLQMDLRRLNGKEHGQAVLDAKEELLSGMRATA
jgi:5-methylcytosine-specific restriction endonuclease McrA